MAKDRLVIDSGRHCWRISWLLAEDRDIGGSLGQADKDGRGSAPADRDDWGHWAASKAVREAPVEAGRPDGRDTIGFYWKSKAGVQAAMRIVKAALKAGQDARPLPGWAKQAIAAGWKAPKGWKP